MYSFFSLILIAFMVTGCMFSNVISKDVDGCDSCEIAQAPKLKPKPVHGCIWIWRSDLGDSLRVCDDPNPNEIGMP